MKRLFSILLLLSALCFDSVYASCDTPPPGSVGEGGGNGDNGGNNGGNTGGNNNGGNNGGSGTGTGTGKELGGIEIDDLICPPGPGGRSLIPTVEAYADDFDLSIEIIFNRDLGRVTAAVIDADGCIVSSAECDTSLIDVVYLGMPTRSGLYTLRISAYEYLGEGHFEL